MPPEAAALAEAIDQEIEDDAAAEGEGEEGGEGGEATDSEEAIRVASLMGWKPKDQWKGDTANWRPAEAFLAEVPDVLRNTRKKADRLEGQHARIVAQLSKIDRGQQRQADAEAKKAAREAMEAGDFDEAEKILTEARAPAAADEPTALTDFKARNEWFGVDDEATAYATALDSQYARAAGGVTDPDAHMRKVEAGVKKRFPELFGEGEKGKGDEEKPRRPPLVARGGRADRTRSSAAMTVADMSPAQRRAAATMSVSDADWVKAYNQSNKDA